MDPVSATGGVAADVATVPATPTVAAASTTAPDFAARLKTAAGKLPKGETLTAVANHDYAQIKGVSGADQFVNLSSNARTGETFERVVRGGHTFHVYGTGSDRVVVRVGAAAAKKS